ncbi:MAG: aspartate-semialdehyde dehydrogenase [Desulfurococcales archaeon]|nr:aspartate-semialdehyde dehydrogenase [Desulfurococcales archaeon]
MISVGVLGASGLVGQRVMSLLWNHPWFEPIPITLSNEKKGKKYAEAVDWAIDWSMPMDMGETKVQDYSIETMRRLGVKLVISAIPSQVAREIEPRMLQEGFNIVSNASPLRLEEDIPLINPEVNADHISLIRNQKRRGWKGYMVKVPNCTTAILTLTLKPIMDSLGIQSVTVSTMQAISGAGFSGLPAVTIANNVIPWISGEEEKVRLESKKILGDLVGNSVRPAMMKVATSTHRVPVIDGHVMSVFVNTIDGADPSHVKEALARYPGNGIAGYNLPTAPEKPVIIFEDEERPQPRLDLYHGNGMSVSVGRLRIDEDTGWLKYIALGHNTVRGAGGTAVLIADLLYYKGLL